MTRRILAVFVALVLATVGTVAVLLYVKRTDDRAVAGTKPVQVLVAKQPIAAGTTGESIRDRQLVELVRMPAGTLPDDVLGAMPPELDKQVLTSGLQARQLVLKGMFGQSTPKSGLLNIPQGKLAVSIEATMAEQVAGYVQPGSKVAVFVTYTTRGSAKGGGAKEIKNTKVLLPEVEVIKVGAYGEGTDTTNGALGGAQANSQANKQILVTVAVDGLQSAKLIYGKDDLYLALLPEGTQVQPGEGVNSENFLD
jgi:pilus assembly protein CpaB